MSEITNKELIDLIKATANDMYGIRVYDTTDGVICIQIGYNGHYEPISRESIIAASTDTKKFLALIREKVMKCIGEQT